MPVCHCGREAKGFLYERPRSGPKDKNLQPKVWCCSMGCLDAAHGNKGMINPTRHEITAIEAASGPAGEYIETLGRTDMATWSESEWMCFLECVITAYSDQMKQLTKSGEPPF